MRSPGKSIVLVGGCFDILHPGHIIFLKKARKAGDELIVLLESDEKVKQIKGIKRPVHSQKMRALMLKSLKFVDRVILLPFMETEMEYDALIRNIKPDIIAATYGDPANKHKKRAARLAGAKLEYVTKMIGNHSTSRILNH